MYLADPGGSWRLSFRSVDCLDWSRFHSRSCLLCVSDLMFSATWNFDSWMLFTAFTASSGCFHRRSCIGVWHPSGCHLSIPSFVHCWGIHGLPALSGTPKGPHGPRSCLKTEALMKGYVSSSEHGRIYKSDTPKQWFLDSKWLPHHCWMVSEAATANNQFKLKHSTSLQFIVAQGQLQLLRNRRGLILNSVWVCEVIRRSTDRWNAFWRISGGQRLHKCLDVPGPSEGWCFRGFEWFDNS